MEQDEDDKALIESLSRATDLDDDDRALLESIKKDYGITDAKPQEKKKGLIERGLNKIDSIGTEINANTEMFADKPLGETWDPVENVSILANRGLRKAGQLGKPIKEGIQGAADKLSFAGDIINKLDPKAGATFGVVSSDAKETLGMAASMVPETSAQAAFLGLTLPFAEIEGIGNSITAAGKRLMPKAAAQAERTAMGAMRKVSDLYPESKLANLLDKMAEGSAGEQRFNIINEAAVNTNQRVISKGKATEALTTAGEKTQGEIDQKLKHDVTGIISEQNTLEESERLGRLKVVGDAMGEQQALAEKKLAQQAELKAIASEKRHATQMTEAHEAAILSDLEVQKAIGLASKDDAGMSVIRDLSKAEFKARAATSNLYNKLHVLAEQVPADTAVLNESFGAMRKDLARKLKVIPEDERAKKLLSVLEDGMEPSTATDADIDVLQGSLSKTTRTNADKLAQKKSKTLSDVVQLYTDLNSMYREKGDYVYRRAAKVVRTYIRGFEGDAGTKAVVNAFDAARESRIRLSAAFENKTLAALLKEDIPANIFKSLTQHSESTMPLSRFMKVAPERAQMVVRRESLAQGFNSINSAKPGKAAEALNAYIERIGQGNIDLMHKGVDLDGMVKLAEAKDALVQLEARSTELAAGVKKTQASIAELIENTKQAIGDSRLKVGKAKEVAFAKQGALAEKARAAHVAERTAVANRIEKAIVAIDKALPIRAKTSTRAGEAGKIIVDGMRKDDEYSSMAVGAGMGTSMLGAGLTAMGYKGLGYATGATGAAMIIAGLAKKSPKVMSELYYSESGRALITRIAQAPNPSEAAKALLELGDALKRPGAYLLIKPQMNDKTPEQKQQGPKLGKLESLRRQEAPAPQPVSDEPQEEEQSEDARQPMDAADPWKYYR